MPPMADLANEFSWSRSRDNAFQDCRRRYFYHYYGAWGGWDAAAGDEVRRLYILKQLAARQMWAGRVVHDAIEMILHAFAEGRDLPVEPFIADVVERMRGEWRSSKAGRYRESPKTVALFEHEYAIDLKTEERRGPFASTIPRATETRGGGGPSPAPPRCACEISPPCRCWRRSARRRRST